MNTLIVFPINPGVIPNGGAFTSEAIDCEKRANEWRFSLQYLVHEGEGTLKIEPLGSNDGINFVDLGIDIDDDAVAGSSSSSSSSSSLSSSSSSSSSLSSSSSSSSSVSSSSSSLSSSSSSISDVEGDKVTNAYPPTEFTPPLCRWMKLKFSEVSGVPHQTITCESYLAIQ